MNKPKNCGKVKNACKYCLQQVTNKTGIQCQGACKKWAHFKCLNYTPGKISDIKAGIIKVMCPCPDCETSQVKEFLTKPPYACSNNTCPANAPGPIKCESDDCPSNSRQPEMQCSNKACPTDAKEFQNHATKPSPFRFSSPHPRSCLSPTKSKKQQSVKKMMARSSSSCENSKCANSSSTECGDDTGQKTQASMVNALQEMCGTVGKLSVQIKELMVKIDKLT